MPSGSGQPLPQRSGVVEQNFGILQQLGAGGGQLGTGAVAEEQLGTELVLERPDLS
ncbi:hypothetical protein [Mycolicibacterium boenickei]|uniref:hypothetical protein n=1 Tax=Mycolicibacterium boenickei TaxID=146017 RepID=UPI002351C593|nr:hypothetical protein [Mycolicibacterium boenickei]